MLLRFETENYKSFCEKMVFEMAPAPYQTGLDYSVFSTQIGTKAYRGLASSVVYGPNATGKSNVISAMDVQAR